MKNHPVATDGAELFAALNQAALAAVKADQPAKVYPAASDALGTLGYQVNIYEVDDDWATLCHFTYGQDLVRRLEQLTGLSGGEYRVEIDAVDVFRAVARQHQTIYIDHSADVIQQVIPLQSRTLAQAVAKLLGIRRLIIAPIHVDDRVQGMLVVLADHIGPDMVPAVTAFASMLGMTLARVQLQANLQQQMATLRETQVQLLHSQKLEAIGRLAAGVAHDVNNLLTPGFFAVEMLRAYTPPQGEEWLDLLDGTVRRTATLTQQLLALGRKQQLKIETLDLSALVDGMTSSLERVIGQGIVCEGGLRAKPSWVLADPAQLEQVLLNLVANARHAVDAGGRLRWGTEISPDEDRVCLVVEDDGLGMSPDQVAHAFEPFFTPMAGGSGRGAGSGLGLAVVQGIVQQHGGTVSIQSRPSQGTKVVVSLPRADGPPAAAPRRAPSVPDRLSALIWVVEDQPEIRALIALQLRKLGAVVAEAATMAQARELLARERRRPAGVDLLISDVILPDGIGTDFVAEAKALWPALPVVIMSGHTLDDAQGRAVTELGGTYLAKPFSPRQLLSLIGGLL